MTESTCALCSVPLVGGHVTLPLGAMPTVAVSWIDACWDHRNDLAPLWDAWIAWHSAMTRRASGELPPLPSSAWVPTPESTQ